METFSGWLQAVEINNNIKSYVYALKSKLLTLQFRGVLYYISDTPYQVELSAVTPPIQKGRFEKCWSQIALIHKPTDKDTDIIMRQKWLRRRRLIIKKRVFNYWNCQQSLLIRDVSFMSPWLHNNWITSQLTSPLINAQLCNWKLRKRAQLGVKFKSWSQNCSLCSVEGWRPPKSSI